MTTFDNMVAVSPHRSADSAFSDKFGHRDCVLLRDFAKRQLSEITSTIMMTIMMMRTTSILPTTTTTIITRLPEE
jgi:hypothetical protein